MNFPDSGSARRSDVAIGKVIGPLMFSRTANGWMQFQLLGLSRKLRVGTRPLMTGSLPRMDGTFKTPSGSHQAFAAAS